MIGTVFGILLALGGIAVLLNWFANASPKAVLKGLRWGGIALTITTVLLLAVTGRLQFLWLAMMWLIPWAIRTGKARQWWNRYRPGGQGSRESRVSTRLLDMRLDLETGEMDGMILDGAQAGRRLSELTTPEVLDLLLFAQGDDPHSVPLIESYLDRMRPDWRNYTGTGDPREQAGNAGESGSQQRSRPSRRAAMSVEEALSVLGLSGQPDENAIKSAHRATMKRVHPDQGGSDEAASRANAAKDVLMKHIGRG